MKTAQTTLGCLGLLLGLCAAAFLLYWLCAGAAGVQMGPVVPW